MDSNLKHIHATELKQAVDNVTRNLDGQTLTYIRRYFDKPTKDWMRKHDIVVVWLDNKFNLNVDGAITSRVFAFQIPNSGLTIGLMETVGCTDVPMIVKCSEDLELSANMESKRFQTKAKNGDYSTCRSGIVFHLEQF